MSDGIRDTAEDVVRSYFHRVRNGDRRVVELFNENATIQGLGMRLEGRDRIRDFYEGILESARPQPTPVGGLLADGDRVMAEIEITLGDGGTVRAVDVFEIDGGEIRSLTYFTADIPRPEPDSSDA